MTLHHYCHCQSGSHQKWPGDQWESTHSCAITAQAHDILCHQCHPKKVLRRSLSDPGMCGSTVTLMPSQPRKEHTIVQDISMTDDDIIVSVHTTSEETDSQGIAQEEPSDSECKPEKNWSEMHFKLDDNDSLFGKEELVHLEDYYYEDEEKSHVISFKNCSLRLHGLLFLIIIYAAGYLAYTFTAPLSKRKCQRPPSVAPPLVDALAAE